MKIGIVTLKIGKNYGGILQAYALQTVLERMGHEVEIINWKQNEFNGFPLYRLPFIYAKRLILGKELRKEYREQQERKVVFQHMEESVKRMIHYSSCIIDSRDTLIDYCNKKEFEAFIVGSDQVWRKSYMDKSFFNKYFHQNTFPNLKTFYLDFVSELNTPPKCIAYAASFGVDYAEYTLEESKELEKLITTFDIVSVREQHGLTLIQDVYQWNKEVKWVLDPTMLLKATDYLSLSKELNKGVSPYLLYYVLDDNQRKLMVMEELVTRLSLFSVRICPNTKSGSVVEKILPSVEDWVSAFANAEFVLTDSFHGMVFSIIFNKPFYVIGNSMRGIARFESLLHLLKLQDRLISDIFDIKSDVLMSSIDWNSVNKILEVEKKNSLSIFKDFLRLVR